MNQQCGLFGRDYSTQGSFAQYTVRFFLHIKQKCMNHMNVSHGHLGQLIRYSYHAASLRIVSHIG